MRRLLAGLMVALIVVASAAPAASALGDDGAGAYAWRHRAAAVAIVAPLADDDEMKEVTPADIAQDAIQGGFVLLGAGAAIAANNGLQSRQNRIREVDDLVRTCQSVMTEITSLVTHPTDTNSELHQNMQSIWTLNNKIQPSNLRAKVNAFINAARPALGAPNAVSEELGTEIANSYQAVASEAEVYKKQSKWKRQR